MMYWLRVACLLLCPTLAFGQELTVVAQSAPALSWSYQAAPVACTSSTSTVSVRSSTSATGTYSTVSTLPIATVTYPLPATANNLFYKVVTACGESNVIQYVSTAPPSPTVDQRVTTLETKVTLLQSNETADDAALAALTTRVTAAETKNTAQDTSLTSLASKNTAQDTAITALQPLAGQLSTLSGTVTASLSALQAKVTALEAAVAALSAPPSGGNNLSVTMAGPDQVNITGLNCTSLRTTGTGLNRTVTCVH